MKEKFYCWWVRQDNQRFRQRIRNWFPRDTIGWANLFSYTAIIISIIAILLTIHNWHNSNE